MHFMTRRFATTAVPDRDKRASAIVCRPFHTPTLQPDNGGDGATFLPEPFACVSATYGLLPLAASRIRGTLPRDCAGGSDRTSVGSTYQATWATARYAHDCGAASPRSISHTTTRGHRVPFVRLRDDVTALRAAALFAHTPRTRCVTRHGATANTVRWVREHVSRTRACARVCCRGILSHLDIKHQNLIFVARTFAHLHVGSERIFATRTYRSAAFCVNSYVRFALAFAHTHLCYHLLEHA